MLLSGPLPGAAFACARDVAPGDDPRNPPLRPMAAYAMAQGPSSGTAYQDGLWPVDGP